MSKNFKEQFTNWLIGIVAALGGFLGQKIIGDIGDLKKDVTELKVAIGIIQEKNNGFEKRFDNLGASNNTRLFKHEDFITLEK